MRWPWKTKRTRMDEINAEWMAIDAWINRAVTDGFRAWEYARPPIGTWVECRRREWATSQVWQESGGGTPLMNVRGLYWRPWTGETVEGSVIEAERGVRNSSDE